MISKIIKKFKITARDNISFLINQASYDKRLKSVQQRLQKLHQSGQLQRILVIRLGSMGDIIRSTAILHSLKEKYPDAEIDFLTSRSNLPVLQNNPDINKLWTIADFEQLPSYDWIANLQTPNPVDPFLDGIKDYDTFLKMLQEKYSGVFITGKHYDKENVLREESNANYCASEYEEFARSAGLTPDKHLVDNTTLRIDGHIDSGLLFEANSEPEIEALPIMGIYIGGNVIGGHDGGFRSYPMSFVIKVLQRYEGSYRFIIIGQSRDKPNEEILELEKHLQGRSDVINLIDKTSLMQLLQVFKEMDILVTCDSGPLHMAIASKTPTVGIFVTGGEFTLGKLSGESFVAIDIFQPCVVKSASWKYFCSGCRGRHKTFDCQIPKFENKFDRFNFSSLEEAITRVGK